MQLIEYWIIWFISLVGLCVHLNNVNDHKSISFHGLFVSKRIDSINMAVFKQIPPLISWFDHITMADLLEI